MADLFVSSSHGDAALVDRCVAWLRWFGITACVAGAEDSASEASPCRAALFFLSAPAFDDAPLMQQLHAVAITNKPVLLVLAESIEMRRLRELPVLDLHTLSVEGLTTDEIGKALLKLLPRMGVLRNSYGSIDQQHRVNEPRSVVVWRARIRFAAVALIGLSLAWFVRTKFASTPAAAVPTVPENSGNVPATPAPLPADAPLVQAPPAADSREARALDFVKQSIASPVRENGLNSAQIEHVVSFFADPVFIEGKGMQPRQLLRSSALLRQAEMPRWQERVELIKAEPSTDPSQVSVITRTNYLGMNAEGQPVTQGSRRIRYVVQFDANNQMLITRQEEMALHRPEATPVNSNEKRQGP